MFTKVYGNCVPSISTVKKLAAEFKREGRPKTAITPETVEKVHNIKLKDRRVKCER
jgi:hypothetical protein